MSGYRGGRGGPQSARPGPAATYTGQGYRGSTPSPGAERLTGGLCLKGSMHCHTLGFWGLS